MAEGQRLRTWKLDGAMNMQQLKRQLLASLSLLSIASLFTACQATAMGQRSTLSPAQQRFQNMGLTLVVDAMEGSEMLGVEFFGDGSEFPFYARSIQRKTGRAIMAFPSGVVPEQVRVTWRETLGKTPSWWANTDSNDDFGIPIKNYVPKPREPLNFDEILNRKIAKRKLISKNINFIHQGPWGGSYAGKVLGDYTIPVASRIPDEVVREIRKNGGGLRLKFRLKPDGVLFGWDIERFAGGLPRHSMPGGDFLETWY